MTITSDWQYTCDHVGLAGAVHLQVLGLEMLGRGLIAASRVLAHPLHEPDRVPVYRHIALQIS